jgi:hypothetical protein
MREAAKVSSSAGIVSLCLRSRKDVTALTPLIAKNAMSGAPGLFFYPVLKWY